MSFMYIPFWRSGGWEDNNEIVTYRTQLYFAPLAQEQVTLEIYLFENGGQAWRRKTFLIEIDQLVSEVTTDDYGRLTVTLGPNQVVRVEINVDSHEYGTGEVHLVGGSKPVPVLARGELESFAAESSGYEMSVSEITMTGSRPIVLEPKK